LEESSHAVFFLAVGSGYALVERPGPAPAPGDIVDVSAEGGPDAGVVAKVGRHPLPGQTMRCAYLL
jgi:hypothetical protein